MSKKSKTQYCCQNCGTSAQKWLGKCPSCGEWNTFVEEVIEGGLPPLAAYGTDSAQWVTETTHYGKVVSLKAPTVEGSEDSPPEKRITTGMKELDRVLGGGLVRDSFILIGGDPGIGKSTLLLQMAHGLSGKVLYVSGEESIAQIRSRAKRLGVSDSDRIFLQAETRLEAVLQSVKETQPQVLIMDSLQTFSSSTLESAPGSVSQVRDVAAKLMHLAKSAGISVWLVGHVTKEGGIAGPKVVEHMVDTVLYFESEGGFSHRLLRTVKNRFGSARELGVFDMEGEGLKEVKNPSALFLTERKGAVPGTAVTVLLEGTRALLVELQALVTSSGLAIPRRTSVGMDSNRVNLLAAIIEKHLRSKLHQYDLYFNVAGGFRVEETASDLATIAAIWSSLEDQPLPLDTVFMGEVALTGEIRRIAWAESRVEEAAKLGYARAVVPGALLGALSKRVPPGFKLLGLDRIERLPELF